MIFGPGQNGPEPKGTPQVSDLRADEAVRLQHKHPRAAGRPNYLLGGPWVVRSGIESYITDTKQPFVTSGHS